MLQCRLSKSFIKQPKCFSKVRLKNEFLPQLWQIVCYELESDVVAPQVRHFEHVQVGKVQRKAEEHDQVASLRRVKVVAYEFLQIGTLLGQRAPRVGDAFHGRAAVDVGQAREGHAAHLLVQQQFQESAIFLSVFIPRGNGDLLYQLCLRAAR